MKKDTWAIIGTIIGTVVAVGGLLLWNLDGLRDRIDGLDARMINVEKTGASNQRDMQYLSATLKAVKEEVEKVTNSPVAVPVDDQGNVITETLDWVTRQPKRMGKAAEQVAKDVGEVLEDGVKAIGDGGQDAIDLLRGK